MNSINWRRIAILIMFVGFSMVIVGGCASPLQRAQAAHEENPTVETAKQVEIEEDKEFEREMQRGFDKENWALCEHVLKSYGVPIWHIGHRFHKGRRVHIHEIRDDLYLHECKRVLGEHWAD